MILKIILLFFIWFFIIAFVAFGIGIAVCFVQAIYNVYFKK